MVLSVPFIAVLRGFLARCACKGIRQAAEQQAATVCSLLGDLSSSCMQAFRRALVLDGADEKREAKRRDVEEAKRKQEEEQRRREEEEKRKEREVLAREEEQRTLENERRQKEEEEEERRRQEVDHKEEARRHSEKIPMAEVFERAWVENGDGTSKPTVLANGHDPGSGFSQNNAGALQRRMTHSNEAEGVPGKPRGAPASPPGPPKPPAAPPSLSMLMMSQKEEDERSGYVSLETIQEAVQNLLSATESNKCPPSPSLSTRPGSGSSPLSPQELGTQGRTLSLAGAKKPLPKPPVEEDASPAVSSPEEPEEEYMDMDPAGVSAIDFSKVPSPRGSLCIATTHDHELYTGMRPATIDVAMADSESAALRCMSTASLSSVLSPPSPCRDRPPQILPPPPRSPVTEKKKANLKERIHDQLPHTASLNNGQSSAPRRVTFSGICEPQAVRRPRSTSVCTYGDDAEENDDDGAVLVVSANSSNLSSRISPSADPHCCSPVPPHKTSTHTETLCSYGEGPEENKPDPPKATSEDNGEQAQGSPQRKKVPPLPPQLPAIPTATTSVSSDDFSTRNNKISIEDKDCLDASHGAHQYFSNEQLPPSQSAGINTSTTAEAHITDGEPVSGPTTGLVDNLRDEIVYGELSEGALQAIAAPPLSPHLPHQFPTPTFANQFPTLDAESLPTTKQLKPTTQCHDPGEADCRSALPHSSPKHVPRFGAKVLPTLPRKLPSQDAYLDVSLPPRQMSDDSILSPEEPTSGENNTNGATFMQQPQCVVKPPPPPISPKPMSCDTYMDVSLLPRPTSHESVDSPEQPTSVTRDGIDTIFKHQLVSDVDPPLPKSVEPASHNACLDVSLPPSPSVHSPEQRTNVDGRATTSKNRLGLKVKPPPPPTSPKPVSSNTHLDINLPPVPKPESCKSPCSPEQPASDESDSHDAASKQLPRLCAKPPPPPTSPKPTTHSAYQDVGLLAKSQTHNSTNSTPANEAHGRVKLRGPSSAYSDQAQCVKGNSPPPSTQPKPSPQSAYLDVRLSPRSTSRESIHTRGEEVHDGADDNETPLSPPDEHAHSDARTPPLIRPKSAAEDAYLDVSLPPKAAYPGSACTPEEGFKTDFNSSETSSGTSHQRQSHAILQSPPTQPRCTVDYENTQMSSQDQEPFAARDDIVCGQVTGDIISPLVDSSESPRLDEKPPPLPIRPGRTADSTYEENWQPKPGPKPSASTNKAVHGPLASQAKQLLRFDPHSTLASSDGGQRLDSSLPENPPSQIGATARPVFLAFSRDADTLDREGISVKEQEVDMSREPEECVEMENCEEETATTGQLQSSSTESQSRCLERSFQIVQAASMCALSADETYSHLATSPLTEQTPRSVDSDTMYSRLDSSHCSPTEPPRCVAQSPSMSEAFYSTLGESTEFPSKPEDPSLDTYSKLDGRGTFSGSSSNKGQSPKRVSAVRKKASDRPAKSRGEKRPSQTHASSEAAARNGQENSTLDTYSHTSYPDTLSGSHNKGYLLQKNQRTPEESEIIYNELEEEQLGGPVESIHLRGSRSELYRKDPNPQEPTDDDLNTTYSLAGAPDDTDRVYSLADKPEQYPDRVRDDNGSGSSHATATYSSIYDEAPETYCSVADSETPNARGKGSSYSTVHNRSSNKDKIPVYDTLEDSTEVTTPPPLPARTHQSQQLASKGVRVNVPKDTTAAISAAENSYEEVTVWGKQKKLFCTSFSWMIQFQFQVCLFYVGKFRIPGHWSSSSRSKFRKPSPFQFSFSFTLLTPRVYDRLLNHNTGQLCFPLKFFSFCFDLSMLVHSCLTIRLDPKKANKPVCLLSNHHQECPIHLGKFSRMRNYSISKTATAELGRARLACSSINTCACSEPRPNLSSERCCKLRLKLLLVDQLTDNWQRRLESWSSSSSLQRGWSARMATRWSSHHPACSIRYQSLHVSSSANDSFKKFTGARSRRPHHSHFSHGRQHRRSSFCRCRTVREEVRIWLQSRGL